MQLRPRSKSRGRSMARTASSMRSRSTRSRARSVSRFSSRSRSSNGSVRGFGNDVQMSFKKRGPNVSAKRKGARKLKVPVKFAKQVNQVLTRRSPTGTVLETFLVRYYPLNADRQQVVDIGEGWQPGFANYTDANRLVFFDPNRILDAASVLFNGKGYSGNKSLSSLGLFSASTMQIEVVDQNVGFEIKNNTARRMTIKLWTWKLKDKLKLTANFVGYWDAANNEEGSTSTAGRLNCYSVTKNTIGHTPTLSPRMKDVFTIEEKIIHLEAGKQTYHQINGFRGVYDFSKFWDGATFNNYNKNVMGVCMAFYPDLICTDSVINGGPGRTTDIVGGDPWGLIVETRVRYTIRMPEQAGFVLPATYTPGSKKLDFRREHPYAVNFQPGPTGAIGNVALINDENPESKVDDAK